MFEEYISIVKKFGIIFAYGFIAGLIIDIILGTDKASIIFGLLFLLYALIKKYGNTARDERG